MPLAYDTFVETGDTDLASHTPTGSNPGTSWTPAAAGAGISVIGATDRCEETSNGNGNRYQMTNDLGSDEMIVQADFTIVSNNALQAIGPMGRLPSGTGTGVEFDYDTSQSAWNLADGTISAQLVEAWPGGAVTMTLVIRQGQFQGFANGVLKVTLGSNAKLGQSRAGIKMLNFAGAAVNTLACDNYQSQNLSLMSMNLLRPVATKLRPRPFAPGLAR